MLYVDGFHLSMYPRPTFPVPRSMYSEVCNGAMVSTCAVPRLLLLPLYVLLSEPSALHLYSLACSVRVPSYRPDLPAYEASRGAYASNPDHRDSKTLAATRSRSPQSSPSNIIQRTSFKRPRQAYPPNSLRDLGHAPAPNDARPLRDAHGGTVHRARLGGGRAAAAGVGEVPADLRGRVDGEERGDHDVDELRGREHVRPAVGHAVSDRRAEPACRCAGGWGDVEVEGREEGQEAGRWEMGQGRGRRWVLRE